MTNLLSQAVRWHRPLMLFAAAMAVLALVCAGGLLFDDRVLVGAPLWLKPLKFAVSFVLYSVTLAWMLSLLPNGRRVASLAGTAIALAGAAEMAAIVGQAIRGRRSHFNVATDLDDRIFQIMGITIAVLWAGTLVIAVVLLRARIADRAGAAAIRLGVLLALAGMALGLLMLRPTPDQQRDIDADVEQVVGAHSVGVPDGGPGLPVTGWSTTGGDLRIPHFVGLHGLQVLPLLALLLGLVLPGIDPVRRLRLVVLGGAVYAGVLALVTWQALRGQPLLHPDGLTLGAAAGLLAIAVAGTAVVLRRAPRRVAPRRVAPDAVGSKV